MEFVVHLDIAKLASLLNEAVEEQKSEKSLAMTHEEWIKHQATLFITGKNSNIAMERKVRCIQKNLMAKYNDYLQEFDNRADRNTAATNLKKLMNHVFSACEDEYQIANRMAMMVILRETPIARAYPPFEQNGASSRQG